MIAVTCRNGEHYSVDPESIERVETTPDTVVHLVDGRKYVISESLDQLLRAIRDHRATVLVVHQQMYGGIAAVAEHRAALRIERRARSRDGNSATTDRLRPDRDEG
jgi:flagellar protein FlbD